MAQKSNNTKYIYYGIGIVILFAIAWTATAPSNTTTTTHSTPPKRYVSTSSADDNVTPADYDVKFDKTAEKPKDAFKPLIYHEQSGGANSNDVSAVPTDFTGGEGGWGFTGTVQVDGALSANMDNSKTGEFIELSRGEHWKKCTVTEVKSDSVTLEGPMSSKTLLMPTVDTATVAAKTTNNTANMPVMPQVDMTTQANTGQVDPNALAGAIGALGGFGGGRGRRGGRGGFGGGRGGRGGGGFGGGGG